MRLYERMMADCTMMARTRVPDGEGGWSDGWEEGDSFQAAVVEDSSTEARVAEASGFTARFTVTTVREMAFHDAFTCGGRTYRITSEGKATPSPATFAFRQYAAERWEVPA